ncbi:hypothetical protein GALMADRAFT_225165 [Galerina marginata CBS 339.88]|uniref:Uncharacterized protein n=1 Tax=Galerina marginata (strain CBS 339.88) TaxID=685588 RepID=A0A067TDH3_GALM3|nr:hypothetical protein GALMADRAFT_225165 [Galerina marginata CBS 339.88]
MLFLDLPVEILPEILHHVIKPQHLRAMCMVNQTFRSFATPRLYERVSIYSWHKDGKVKVIKLFDTLSRSAYLASLLHVLEIRDFPKAITTLDGDILKHVQRGLRNCSNLRSCTWTRDGSLNSEILEALNHCQSLRELELNGHNEGHYDPRALLGFANLRRISIIMPSLAVVSQFDPWLSLTGNTLRSFTLICKASTIITDSLLESIAVHLVNLEHLQLTGCPKVTHRGVWTLVSSNINGLIGLGLEGVSPKFDMATFARQCITSGTLTRLRSVTLTVQQQLPMKEWIAGVIDLLSTSPLELFQIYSTGAFFESPMTDNLWKQLISTHGKRLIRFSVHRMLISLEAINDICLNCNNLEQLFVVVEPASLDRLSRSLSQAKKLRTVHINYPMEAFMEAFPVLKPDQALSIINRCSATVTQFGCNARVWQVERQVVRDEEGKLQTRRTLAPYGSPEVPEQFLVVRT